VCRKLPQSNLPAGGMGLDGIDQDCDGDVDEGTAGVDDDGDEYCEGADNDGKADFIVGARSNNSVDDNAGRAFLLLSPY